MYLAGVITPGRRHRRRARGDAAPRIVADGRTFSYVLHARRRAASQITQNDVRAIQLAQGRAVRRRCDC